MLLPDTETIKKLREATDAAIGRICECSGAINWADLHCIQAAMVVTDDGKSYLEVLIAEVDPAASEFRRAVELELAQDGWPDIQVVTEW